MRHLALNQLFMGLGIMAVVWGIIPGVSQAQPVEVIITADNGYGFGWGPVTGLTNYFGAYEASSASQIFNCPVGDGMAGTCQAANCGPESYIIPPHQAMSGDHLYIVAWADLKTTNGVLGQFKRGNQPPVYTGAPGWEVCATGMDFNTVSGGPSFSTINSEIAKCNQGTSASGGWVDTAGNGTYALAVGEDNSAPGGTFPTVCGVDTYARWMWGDNLNDPLDPFTFPLNSPVNHHLEFLIFRLPASDVGQLPCPDPKDCNYYRRLCEHPAFDDPDPWSQFPPPPTELHPVVANCVNNSPLFPNIADSGDLCDALRPSFTGQSLQDRKLQARVQVLTLLLNTCTAKIWPSTCIASLYRRPFTPVPTSLQEQSPSNVGNAIQIMEEDLDAATNRDDVSALAALALSINKGTAVCDCCPSTKP